MTSSQLQPQGADEESVPPAPASDVPYDPSSTAGRDAFGEVSDFGVQDEPEKGDVEPASGE